MSSPTPQSGILDIAPYVGGEGQGSAHARVIKLSSNESAFGVSPKVAQAMAEFAGESHRYPDGGCYDLRVALGEKHGIDPVQIVCGAGSDEIISLLCQAYTGAGDEVVYTEHGFLMYAISAKANGAIPVKAPEIDCRADVQNILDTVNAKTKIVFLANPNNPTGSYLSRDELQTLHAGLPAHVLLVIDAAYAEFVTAEDYTAGHDLVAGAENIIVTRTFSKAYGLGGLRLGWAHGSADVIDVLNRVRGPFNVSSLAQVAGIAALADDGFLAQAITHNTQCRGETAQTLRDAGLIVYPSEGNFILVDFETPENAEGCRQFLKTKGVFVRQMESYGLPSCLRMSIGLDDEMKLACDAVVDYIKAS